MNAEPQKIWLLAGEPSGDALGGKLIHGLKERLPHLEIGGVGGEEMKHAGLNSLFSMSDLSVMGIGEVLPRLPLILRRLNEITSAAIQAKPDIMITIDAPDFSFRLQRRLRKAAPKIRLVHYGAPTVWAWRPGRARKIAGFLDQLLALFPFEPPYFETHGLRCDFVGHPIAAREECTPSQIENFREKYRLQERKLLLLLPGSRKSEVSRLAPVFSQLANALSMRRPELHFLLPMAQGISGEDIGHTLPENTLILPSTSEDKQIAFAAADAALAASGTVSLELAASNTPMVIAYDAGWLTRQVARLMIKTDTVTLPNLITGKREIEEFLGENCKAELLLPAVEKLLDAPKQQSALLKECMKRLGRGQKNIGSRAAEAILDGFRG